MMQLYHEMNHGGHPHPLVSTQRNGFRRENGDVSLKETALTFWISANIPSGYD